MYMKPPEEGPSKSTKAHGKVSPIMKDVVRKADVIEWVSQVHLWPKTRLVNEAKAFQTNDTEVLHEFSIDNNLNKSTPLDVISKEGSTH
jgi:hypothetical protein